MLANVVDVWKQVSVVLATTVMFSAPAFGTDIVTLELQGGPAIPGDAAFVSAHAGLPADSIEVLSLQQGVSNSISVAGGVGKPSFSAFVFVKFFGASTPGLFLATAEGRNWTTAIINFYHATHVLQKYYTITLTHAIVQSIQYADTEGTTLTTNATESLSLLYTQIQLHDLVSNQTSCWNIVSNKSC